jgi:hypothetical protein
MNYEVTMKKVLLILSVVLITFTSITGFAESEIIFDLFPQARPYIYSVGYEFEGENRWYQLQWTTSQGLQHCDVFYDEISKNFYCTMDGDITIIPIKRKYKFRINKKQN